MKAFEKRRKAEEALRKAATLSEKAAAEGRLRTEDENQQIEALNAEAARWQSEADADDALYAKLGNGGNGRGPETAPIVVVKDRFEDDPARGFKSPRDFMLSVIHAGRPGGSRNLSDNLKSLAAGSDEAGTYDDVYGGFLVPVAYAPGLLQLTPAEDPIASRVQQIPMAAPKVFINARVDKNHSVSPSGGFVVYRRAETSAVTAKRAQFEQIELNADTLMGLSYATEELLNDSPISFAAIIATGFQDAFTYKLINERLGGTGVGMFTGILNSECLIPVDAEGGQSADTINGLNILKMRKRCWGYQNSVWLANPDTYVELAGAHITGTNGDVFLFNPSRGEDVPDMLLGRPVVFTEYAKTLGDLGDLLLTNWSQYLEGTYQPIQNASSVHVRFVEHEQAFKLWLRNAGAPWWSTVMTPVNSADTLSPFVALAAR